MVEKIFYHNLPLTYLTKYFGNKQFYRLGQCTAKIYKMRTKFIVLLHILHILTQIDLEITIC